MPFFYSALVARSPLVVHPTAQH